MNPFMPKRKTPEGPESKIKFSIKAKLQALDWAVIVTHGNEYQMGLPDLYCAHRTFGARWIEVKNPDSYKFTDAQMEVFPLLTSKGIGIWVLTADTDEEIKKIIAIPPNWYQYLPIMRIK